MTATETETPSYLQMGHLRVVEDACRFSSDMNSGEVIIKSNLRDFPVAIEDLSGGDARTLAAAYASHRGMASVALDGIPDAPVGINAEGVDVQSLYERQGSQTFKPEQLRPVYFQVKIRVRSANRR